MNPVKASLRYPVVTAILTAMAVGVGVHALLTMPRTEDPSITIREGMVLAAYPGATSEQVENPKAGRTHLQVPGSTQAEDVFDQPAGAGIHRRPAGGQRKGCPGFLG